MDRTAEQPRTYGLPTDWAKSVVATRRVECDRAAALLTIGVVTFTWLGWAAESPSARLGYAAAGLLWLWVCGDITAGYVARYRAGIRRIADRRQWETAVDAALSAAAGGSAQTGGAVAPGPVRWTGRDQSISGPHRPVGSATGMPAAARSFVRVGTNGCQSAVVAKATLVGG